MVVAVIAMRVVQVAIDQIVHMVSVRHRGVTAARPMNVIRSVRGAGVLRRASARIGRRDRKDVLIHMVAMRMVKMTIVEIVDVPFMLYRHMATLRAVLVFMVVVMALIALGHVRAPGGGNRAALRQTLLPRDAGHC